MPLWNFGPTARLSEYRHGVDFGRFAVPPGTEMEMSAVDAQKFANSLRYLAAQVVSGLSNSSNRLDRFSAAADENSRLKTDVAEISADCATLQTQISQDESLVKALKSRLEGLQRDRDAVLVESSGLESMISLLSGEVASSRQELADLQGERVALQVHVNSLFLPGVDVGVVREELNRVTADLDWLVADGAMGIIDQVFELEEFGVAARRYRDAVFAAREQAGRTSLYQELKDGKVSADLELPAVDHDLAITAAYEDLATLEYGALLRLGELDVAGLRELPRAIRPLLLLEYLYLYYL